MQSDISRPEHPAVQVESQKHMSFDRPRKPQMFLWPYILFLHKESYLTILMFLDYSIVTECFFNYRPYKTLSLKRRRK